MFKILITSLYYESVHTVIVEFDTKGEADTAIAEIKSKGNVNGVTRNIIKLYYTGV